MEDLNIDNIFEQNPVSTVPSTKKFKVDKKSLALIAGGLVIGIVIGLLISSPAITGAAVSQGSLQDSLAVLFPQVKLQNMTEEGDLYKVEFTMTSATGEQDGAFYVTKDGKYLIPGELIDLQMLSDAQKAKTAETPKTDKPIVDLYIFSYCPAGTAALDSYAKVADALKGKADFKVKFFSNMHGEHEKQQNMIQECIQVVAPDKYWAYAKQYAGTIYKTCGEEASATCDKEESIKLMKSVGIDADKVMAEVLAKGEQYYSGDKADAEVLKLSYSPSIVINGVYLEKIDRSPEGIKEKVCSTFNTIPEECVQELSADGATTTGNCG